MTITLTSDPPFMNIARQAHKLMEQMQKGYFNYCPTDTWTPSVNLYETADHYLVCADLAGVDKTKIELEIRENKLRLSGSRQVPRPETAMDESADEAAISNPPEASQETGKIRVHLMEIDHGTFCREVELPLNVDRDRITANYRNGMLWIEIPKA